MSGNMYLKGKLEYINVFIANGNSSVIPILFHTFNAILALKSLDAIYSPAKYCYLLFCYILMVFPCYLLFISSNAIPLLPPTCYLLLTSLLPPTSYLLPL